MSKTVGQDDRLTAPAAARNRGPILVILRRVLPARGLVLEVASGTGEHALFFSQALRQLTWQPTDAEPANLRSIAAWSTAVPSPHLLPPLMLDATRPETCPVRQADAILAINLIHIAPWAATQGLFAGAAAALPAGGPLVLYGPFREAGRHTAASNEDFDADLRSRNPQWGLRALETVAALGADHGFDLHERVEMPANNVIFVFRRLPVDLPTPVDTLYRHHEVGCRACNRP